MRAFYPAGYHLLLRDHERITPIDDILAWIRHPGMPLPSGARSGGKGVAGAAASDREALLRPGFRAMGLRTDP